MNQIDFLNIIRNEASEMYQDRIPLATRQNLAEIQGTIVNDTAIRNEFYDMMNKVGKTIIYDKKFTNPLKAFKREEIPYGSVIEEIGLDRIEGKVYNPTDQSVYATNRPTMKALYNIENRRSLYDTTRNLSQLKGAFKGESGLMEFANSFASNLLSSAEIDEFLIMKELLKQANYAEVNIPALDGSEAKTTTFIEAIRHYISKLKYPNREFNELGFLQNTPVEDLRLIVREDVMNDVDLKVLASLFNKEMAEFRATTLLVDNFNDDEDTYAIICDKDFLNIFDSLNTTRDVENPRTLDMTFILHIWQICFTSKFVQAVKIRKEVLPTSATISDATLTLSIAGAEEATISIEATAPDNASYTQYSWASADEAKVAIVSSTPTSCKVKVKGGSANDTVVITATNLGKNTITKTCTITLEA